MIIMDLIQKELWTKSKLSLSVYSNILENSKICLLISFVVIQILRIIAKDEEYISFTIWLLTQFSFYGICLILASILQMTLGIQKVIANVSSSSHAISNVWSSSKN